MWFWVFVLLCDLIIPFTMIAFGSILKNHPPKDINGVYGYRTSRSKKNKDTWHFANTYCGSLWQKVGWIMLVGTIAAHLPLLGRSEEDAISMLVSAVTFLQCAVLIGCIFPVERALKREFDDNGVRRNYGKTKEEKTN